MVSEMYMTIQYGMLNHLLSLAYCHTRYVTTSLQKVMRVIINA